MKIVLAVLLLAAVPANAACPNAGLKTGKAVFVTATGRHAYTMEIARTGEQQACGLMFRGAMPRRTGMIFPFPQPRPAAFWMQNTPLPLDLIFVSPKNRVINVGYGKPFSQDLIEAGGITAAVIELNAGEAARIGLKPGDQVIR